MTQQLSTNGSSRILLHIAAAVIILAGLKAAQGIIIPTLVALFIAIVCAPPVYYMNRRGIRGSLAVSLMILAIILFFGLIVMIVGSSIDDFTSELPRYQARVQTMTQAAIEKLKGWGVPIKNGNLLDHVDPSVAMGFIGTLLGSLGTILSNLFLILLLVIFILFESFQLPLKFRHAVKSKTAEQTFEHFGEFATSLNRYLGIKTIISLVTGAVVAFALWLLNVDFPLLWGLLAFLFNFIPTIGSILAAVPVILLALVQLGWQSAVWVMLVYATVNVVMGNGIEPKVMGKGVGLSTLMVFISLIFWGWVFGPVGMLLSVPLTMSVKIALQVNPDTRWIAKLLGPPVSNSTKS
ncbi:MAG: AI-2E family transporter [Gammaproteobacteria bacterium]|nr:AI-2E family transporter [Gammaproteobacteria bacterium]